MYMYALHVLQIMWKMFYMYEELMQSYVYFAQRAYRMEFAAYFMELCSSAIINMYI